jgi:hypothetical protein
MNEMRDLEKLEYIHCSLQEALKLQDAEIDQLEKALSFVEDLREPFFEEMKTIQTFSFITEEYKKDKKILLHRCWEQL